MRYLVVLLLFAAAGARAQSSGLEAEIRAFLTADSLKPPPKGQIVLWGSSSLRLWSTAGKDLATDGLTVINRGFGGSQAEEANRWFGQVIVPLQPAWLLFYEGDNDINAGKSLDQVYADMKKSVALVRKHLPNTRLLVLAVKPSGSRIGQFPTQQALNRKVAKLCKHTRNVWWVDTATPVLDPATGKPDSRYFQQDQLHLNAAGYALWTSVIREKMQKIGH